MSLLFISKLELKTIPDETGLTQPQKRTLVAAFINILKPNFDIHARKVGVM